MSGQPYKDTFHSTHVQPEAATDGDVPGDILNEHYPDLHSAVSFFSKGTVLLGRYKLPADRSGTDRGALIKVRSCLEIELAMKMNI